MIDKLRLSVKGDHADDELPPIDKLIHTILLTAQGVPFIRAGEEMMQDKQGNRTVSVRPTPSTGSTGP